MRVALISLTERAGDEPETPLAALALAGKSLAERQLELALALGCERIVCLSHGLDKGLIRLQHRAEGAGATFNMIAGPRPLAGLVNAADELIVVAPGLLPSPSEAKAALEHGSRVLVLPVEAGVAAGFERIDLNHAWAGVLAMPGRLVERLSQLPPDCDAISALLRIALQGRVPERALPDAVLSERRWALVASRRQLAEIEPDWFRRHVATPSPFAPGRALSRISMRKFGGTLLERGWKPAFLAGSGVLLAGLGAVGAWFGQGIAGIAACGAGWLLCEAAGGLGMIARAGAGDDAATDRAGLAAGWLVDLALVVTLAMALSGAWPGRIFAPLVLLGSARLAGRLIDRKWAEIAQDRAVLAVILVLAAAGSALLPAIQVLALALIGALIGLTRGSAKLTQV